MSPSLLSRAAALAALVALANAPSAQTVRLGPSSGALSIVRLPVEAGSHRAKPVRLETPAGAVLPELIVDGSFEDGAPNPAWDEAGGPSFSTPICPASECPAPGPRTGSWYAFFNGEGVDSEYSLAQSVTIPADATGVLLSFWLQIRAAGDATGTFSYAIDGVEIDTFTEADTAAYADYAQVNIDIGAFADGLPHTLTFRGVERAGTAPDAFVTFVLDDVSLISTGGGGGDPTTSLNDNLTTAEPVYAGQATYTGDTREAEASALNVETAASCTVGGADNDDGNAIWWAFEATASGTVSLDLAGSSFDTILSLYLSGDDGALTEVSCNDDDASNPSGDFTSALSADVTPGLYFVRVSGYGGSVGDVVLTVAAPGVITGPPNDDPFRSGVQEIAIGSTHLDTNRGATASGFPPPTCGTATGPVPDVWRVVVVPEAGTLTIDTEGSGFDTVVSVYATDEAGEVDPTTPAACNDDDPANAADDGSSRVSFEALPGVAYMVQTTSDGSEGDLLYTVAFEASPPIASEAAPGARLALLPAAPNPAAGPVRLGATLAEAADVRVEVFDALGRSAGVVFEGAAPAGRASWTWDAAGRPAGVYVVRVVADGEAHAQRVTVVR
ncbi:pre-peptidase C-terminal domain-containing protein [Rubrivirga marina]|uniref:Peptidase C-terminal archaeal/bacterial domain-containing protein n=1 Tax=Rubrivirga marina TaxID=1196024 RepID=A0A271IWA2_9BACT|nr:pre-peptidase C-terminal domain-containing protein [Rubrivirga marina]PAP75472.1 hypothetical protein BSZ37_02930 [Rubrivirga marina]